MDTQLLPLRIAMATTTEGCGHQGEFPMLEAVSFKEDDVMTMGLLLGGANQTAIWSIRIITYMYTYMYMCWQIMKRNN